ncbi:MAG: EthD family reductase [Anaerolineales bacterium]
MHKLMILFRTTADPIELETRWSQNFVRLAEKMPGLRRVSVSRILGGPGGQVDLHLVHEFYFDNLAAVQQAMASPEGQEAGRALMEFAGESATLLFAEHLEEARSGGG